MVHTEASPLISLDFNHSSSIYPSSTATPGVVQEDSLSVSNFPPSSEPQITHKITSAAGIVERVRVIKHDMAIGLLAAWSHPRREREINDTLLNSLKTLPKEDAVGIVTELKEMVEELEIAGIGTP